MMSADRTPEQGRTGFAIWRQLTEPLASSRRTGEQHCPARLLSSLLLVLLAATAASIVASSLMGGTSPGVLPRFCRSVYRVWPERVVAAGRRRADQALARSHSDFIGRGTGHGGKP